LDVQVVSTGIPGRDGGVVVIPPRRFVTEDKVVEERPSRLRSERIVERSPLVVDKVLRVFGKYGSAVSDAMGPRVTVLEPFTTHSKLLLPSQGVELEVDICEYFNDAL
jgi:hypothetical protein